MEEDVTVAFTYYMGERMESSQGNDATVTLLEDVTFPAGSTEVPLQIEALRIGSVVMGLNSTNKNLER